MPRIAIAAAVLLVTAAAIAQDVPGIENCTAEKSLERRTGCMQSNINYLHQQIARMSSDSRTRLETATREIETLKATVARLQAGLDELQAAAKKAAEPKPK